VNHHGAAILQCEQFLPPPSAPSRSPALIGAIHHTGSGMCPEYQSLGDCLFPKPETGVWCCEEFR
jgi:hypothetical protein